jgi:hypothetical protein
VRPEGFGELNEVIHFVGSRIRDLAACSIMS